MLQLLFLAKAASHKLYCNYRSAYDFYHLGHMWSLPSTFKLNVKRSNPYTVIAHSFTSSLSFSVAQVLIFFVSFSFSFFLILIIIQVMTGAGRTLNLLFSVSKYAAFHDSFPGRVWLRGALPEDMSQCTGNFFSSPCCCTQIHVHPSAGSRHCNTENGAVIIISIISPLLLLNDI